MWAENHTCPSTKKKWERATVLTVSDVLLASPVAPHPLSLISLCKRPLHLGDILSRGSYCPKLQGLVSMAHVLVKPEASLIYQELALSQPERCAPAAARQPHRAASAAGAVHRLL